MSHQDDVWLSPFIFTGQVRKRRAATLALVDVTELDAVVAVERVLRKPPSVIDFSGQEVTLRGNSAVELEDERTALFAADGWLYGDTLALLEVARMDEDQSADEKIKAAEQRAAEDALRSRLARANLVVVAVVERTNPRDDKAQPPTSEHDPIWWEAWLQVESAEKGQPPPRLRVLYPSSTDEYWYESPKFAPGDDGVFLLQQDQKEHGPARYHVRGFTALDPLDYQPRERLDELRRLMRR
ncbi:MAG: hypothetical protein ACJ74L_04050 [Gaiellaceae bacterium]